MIHAFVGAVLNDVRFHHTTQNCMQFKTHALLISGIFHLKTLTAIIKIEDSEM